MAYPGVVLAKRDSNNNLVRVAPATYSDYIVTVFNGAKKSLTATLSEISTKHSQQDTAISNAASRAELGITNASNAQLKANDAYNKATTNATNITNVGNKFGPVTKFNYGTAQPTYSCADGEVYFQIK